MRLIGSLTSPYVRKVRVVLAEKKLEYRFEAEDPWAAETKVPQSNPLGKVPCLLLEGGDALHDSRVIVEYVDTLSPVGRLIPDKGRERAIVKTWEATADGILDAAVSIRLEATWPGRQPQERSQAWVDRQVGKIHAALGSLSSDLGDRPWFVGTQPTLADLAVGVALGYLDFRLPKLVWREAHPQLVRLSDKLEQRVSFQSTRPPQN